MTADNQLLTAIMDDLEIELFLDMPALIALDKTGKPQLRRWWRGAFDRLATTAIASALRDLDALAYLDELEIRAEL